MSIGKIKNHNALSYLKYQPLNICKEYESKLLVLDSLDISEVSQNSLMPVMRSNDDIERGINRTIDYNQYIATTEKNNSGYTAVIAMSGVMARLQWSWHGWVIGTIDIENTIKKLENDSNVNAIILHGNTGGGEGIGNVPINRLLKSCKTPTYLYIDQVMASAGIEAFLSADKIYAGENSAIIGSIGSFTTFYDYSEMYEQNGIKKIEVYAPQSDLKNAESREAIDGDTSRMEKRLENGVKDFINTVKKSRKVVDDGKVFRGDIYNAKEAQKINLIDGIKSFDDVLIEASEAGKKYQKKQIKLNSRNSKFYNMDDKALSQEEKTIFESVAAKLGYTKTEKVAESETNAAEKDAKIAELTSQLEAKNTALAAANKATEDEKAARLVAENSLTEANVNVETLKGEKATLETFKSGIEATLAGIESTEKFGAVTPENIGDFAAKLIAHNKDLGKSEKLTLESSKDADGTFNKKDNDSSEKRETPKAREIKKLVAGGMSQEDAEAKATELWGE